jgi:hypothetical protein
MISRRFGILAGCRQGGPTATRVGVAGQLGGASAGAFGQVALGQRLESPGDALDEPGAVAGVGGFAEQFGEALPQLAHAQTLQRRDLGDDVHFHRVLLSGVEPTVNPCGQ